MVFMRHLRFLASSSPTTTDFGKIQFFNEITHEYECRHYGTTFRSYACIHG